MPDGRRRTGGSAPEAVSDADYARLLAVRDELRRFLRFSDGAARAAGLTPAQHQLLLAVRGHPGAPTIAEVAEHLLVRHHSAVELVDRAEARGLIERRRDPDDHRLVRLRCTPEGAAVLASLAGDHLDELRRLAPRVAALGPAPDPDH